MSNGVFLSLNVMNFFGLIIMLGCCSWWVSVESTASEQAPESAVSSKDSVSHKTEENNSSSNKLTFKEVLAASYNLTYLKSAQYDVQGGYESLSTAKRDWLPTVNIQSSYAADFNHQRTNQSYQNGSTPPGSVTENVHTHKANNALSLNQNLFAGGKTTAGIRAQKYGVEKSRAAYSKQECSFLAAVIKAYSDLVLKKLIYGVRIANLKVLQEQVAVARSSNELGANTISDVAQTEAKLAKVKAAISLARAEVEGARANFERLTGLTGDLPLEHPPLPDNLPQTKEEAIQWALENNPDLKAAEAESKQYQEFVKQVRSDLLPSIDVGTSVAKNVYSSWGKAGFQKNETDQFEAMASLKIPLDFRGSSQASLRKQKYEAAKKRIDSINLRRKIIADIVNKWEIMVAKLKNIQENQEQVKAAKVAYDCMKEEFTAGMKTTLHLLSAEQEYFSAQIEWLASQQDHLQSAYELLAEIGILNAKFLDLPVESFVHEEYANVPVWGTSIKE